eukprot:2613028-Rhodomonas_salina.2
MVPSSEAIRSTSSSIGDSGRPVTRGPGCHTPRAALPVASAPVAVASARDSARPTVPTSLPPLPVRLFAPTVAALQAAPSGTEPSESELSVSSPPPPSSRSQPPLPYPCLASACGEWEVFWERGHGCSEGRPLTESSCPPPARQESLRSRLCAGADCSLESKRPLFTEGAVAGRGRISAPPLLSERAGPKCTPELLTCFACGLGLIM